MRKSACQRLLRVILAIVFLPGSFVSAGVRHAHSGGDQTFDHDARPHVHIARLAHVGHSHGAGHSHHHPTDGTHSHPPATDSKPEHDGHDSDAVYLPNDICVSLLTKSVRPPDNQQVITPVGITLELSTTHSVNAFESAFSPGESSPARPLYLALRALRI